LFTTHLRRATFRATFVAQLINAHRSSSARGWLGEFEGGESVSTSAADESAAFGRAAQGTGALINRFLPTYAIRQVDRVAVAAGPELAWRFVRDVDLYQVGLARWLFALRLLPESLIARLAGRPSPVAPTARIDDFTAPGLGFQILAEQPGREIVVGAVGRFWQPRIDFVSVTPTAFAGFAEPGFGKVAWSLAVVEREAGGAWITVDLRVAFTDSAARARFRPYWALVGRFSHAIRRDLLRLCARRLGTPAEAARQPGPARSARRAAVADGLAAAWAALSGGTSFRRQVARQVEALYATSHGQRPTVVTAADLAGLPEPVQRWLHWAEVVGKERPITVRLKQVGRFRLAPDRGWLPFEAEEYFTTDPPGFLWPVRMRLAPLLCINGWDRFVGGTGEIQMRLLSLIPLASKRGGGLNQGALLRYLNEMMWFPAAALSPCIAWETVDARSARATITSEALSASATFFFGRDGRLVDMVAERFNDSTGRLETWSTPLRAYGEFEGVQVPVEGEGVWKYTAGDFPYIRLRVTELQYNRPALYP
jgi:uncharacterized protein DUF6544